MSSIHSFGGETSHGKDKGKKPEIEEIELSLSLSLNGKFGVVPNAKVEKRICSSSLVRTCSVQVGKGEGKKEEEINLIKKMAKRKRMERMSIVRAVRERIEDDGYVGSKSIHENYEVNYNFYGYGRGIGITKLNDFLPPPLGVVVEESDEGSSPGCGSSDVSDPTTGHQAIQAPNNSTEARTTLLSPPEHIEHKVAVISRMETPSVAVADGERNESKKKLLIKAMGNRGWPYVFTSLDSPNHVKVEGFLQKYSSGQPVKIVCICHGMYHSPAEFVKHAGGDAIENPLKHIVVTLPSAS